MFTPVTEVVVLPVQQDVLLGEHMKGLSQILARQPGFQRFHWGQWEESPHKVQLFIDWASLNAHRDFEGSGTDYDAVGALLGPILAGAPDMHHALLVPKISEADFVENVTEIVTFHGLSQTFESELGIFLLALSKAPGFKGVSKGNVVEKSGVGADCKAEKTYKMIISWLSIEDHVAAMTTKVVREALKSFEGAAREVEMHHVKFSRE